ncbi:hypothetical protein [Sulfurovum sp. NBC37-1]|uniref:hypothetical protein n=1 Tax=Sulfurovum sp. (strain NBC37-1) TaxID=387093 RepID=UPI0001587A0C|nr:hypothetical protein [Sulfurovum sp. NBC37-1]BAF72977.1 hypothetical protein SUN_2035 [Sulfurovum sp. NBC37-1]
MKNIILGVMFIILGGCVNTDMKSRVDTSSLPEKCGEYEVHYGVPHGYKKADGSVGEPITLNGKNMSYLDAKYVGKEVAVFTWVQVVGGLPMPDGSGGEATYYYNPKRVLPLRNEYNILNCDAIDNTCRELKRREY